MKFEIKWKGAKHILEWFDEKYTGQEKPSGCQGFIFNNSGQICIVKTKSNGYWQLPGGGIEEYDKTPLDAFLREVEEEVDLDLENVHELGYVTGIKKINNNDKKIIQIKYIAKIHKIKPQTIDIAEGSINERIFISPKDFNEYMNWGKSGEFQIQKALKTAKELGFL